MATVHLDYTPFEPQQADFHLAQARIKAAVTGARGGKTQMGVAEMRDDAICQPDHHPDDIKRGEPYRMAIGAPTYPMLSRVIIPAMELAIPKPLLLQPYSGSSRLMIVRGMKRPTYIWFITGSSYEAWQGLKLNRVWLDEFALMKETMLDEAMTRVSDRQGGIILTGTPRGPTWPKTRIYDEFVRDGQTPDLHFSTWRTIDNPHIPKDEVERARRKMSKRYFHRTFEASWDAFEGQIFEEWLPAVHVKKLSDFKFILPGTTRTVNVRSIGTPRAVGAGPKVVKLEHVVAGVDWGHGSGHPGVIAVWGKAEGVWYMLDESVAEGVLVAVPQSDGKAPLVVDSWVRRAYLLKHRWNIEMFYCDSENPGNVATFQAARLPALGVPKPHGSVENGIECVGGFMHVDELTCDTHLFVLGENCPTACDEFSFYHWEEKGVKPAKENDHVMDASRYAIYTFETIGVFRSEGLWSPKPRVQFQDRR